MSALTARLQQPDADQLVTLFELDATALGGTVLRFTPMSDAGAAVTFGGNDYEPIDFDSEGWELTGKGPFPRPKIRIANTTNVLSAVLLEFGDLLGAKVTRIRTLAMFLDGRPDADPAAELGRDVYSIDRIATRNKVFVEFELAAAMDQQGRLLPAQQVTRTCSHIYRSWSGSAFDYTRATCPYAGAAAFDINANPVASAQDRCGKQIRDCKARFGTAELPFRGCPGVARVRV